MDLGVLSSTLAGWPMFNGNLFTFRDANALRSTMTVDHPGRHLGR